MNILIDECLKIIFQSGLSQFKNRKITREQFVTEICKVAIDNKCPLNLTILLNKYVY